jgi:hypothetical protein
MKNCRMGVHVRNNDLRRLPDGYPSRRTYNPVSICRQIIVRQNLDHSGANALVEQFLVCPKDEILTPCINFMTRQVVTLTQRLHWQKQQHPSK